MPGGSRKRPPTTRGNPKASPPTGHDHPAHTRHTHTHTRHTHTTHTHTRTHTQQQHTHSSTPTTTTTTRRHTHKNAGRRDTTPKREIPPTAKKNLRNPGGRRRGRLELQARTTTRARKSTSDERLHPRSNARIQAQVGWLSREQVSGNRKPEIRTTLAALSANAALAFHHSPRYRPTTGEPGRRHTRCAAAPPSPTPRPTSRTRAAPPASPLPPNTPAPAEYRVGSKSCEDKTKFNPAGKRGVEAWPCVVRDGGTVVGCC